MSADGPDERRRLIPAPVVRWLILIAVTFVIGGLACLLFPSAVQGIVGVGVIANVALAVIMGVVLGWRMTLEHLPAAIGAGAIVTVMGTDCLYPGLLPFDAVALVIAVIGMSVLLGIGAAGGTVARGLRSGCRCLLGPPRHGGGPSSDRSPVISPAG
jgi:hypothetical protein